MDDNVAQKLGELTAEVRNGNRRQDEMFDLLRRHIVDDDKVAGRVASLEISRASAKGSINGMKWLATAAFAIATALGAERIVQFLTSFPHA